MTALNAVSAVVGIAYTVVVAYYFGTSRTLEVYFAAVAVQVSLMGFIQLGQMTEIFLPVYHRLKQRLGQDEAFAAFSVLLNWIVLAAVALSVLAWWAAPVLMRLRVPGFAPEDIALGIDIFRYTVPLLVLQVANGLMAALAHAEKWFGRPEALQVGGRLLGLGCVAALVPGFGIWALVVGLVVSNGFTSLGYLVVVLRLGYRHRLCLRRDAFRVTSVLRQLMVTFTYVGATQVYAFVFDAALSMLPQGVFAVFKYVAQTLVAKARPIVFRPLSVVFFTQFSTAFAAGAANLRGLASTALARMLAVSAVLFVGAETAGRPLLGALWGPSRFGVDDLRLAATLVTLLFAMSVIEGFGQISRKVGATLGKMSAMYVLAAGSQLVAAAMAWTFTSAAGTPGAIAAYMAAGMLLNLAFAVPTVLSRREYFVWYDGRLLLKWAAAVAISCVVGAVLSATLPIDWAQSRLHALVLGILVATPSVATLFVAAWLLRIGEVGDLVRWLRQSLLARPRPG